MKKNASCKGIRTNFINHTNSFRPLSKKPMNIDLVSHKPHCPSTSTLILELEHPSTAKAPVDALRKKIFSSSKNIITNN